MKEAQKPFMGMVQNGFMMWMSGSHITIWSMMMTSMGIFNPISAIANVNQMFKRVSLCNPISRHQCRSPLGQPLPLMFSFFNLLALRLRGCSRPAPGMRWQFEDGDTDLTTPKLVYVALNLASLGVALYKCKSMGLLPVTAADWTGLLPEATDAEVSGVAM